MWDSVSLGPVWFFQDLGLDFDSVNNVLHCILNCYRLFRGIALLSFIYISWPASVVAAQHDAATAMIQHFIAQTLDMLLWLLVSFSWYSPPSMDSVFFCYCVAADSSLFWWFPSIYGKNVDFIWIVLHVKAGGWFVHGGHICNSVKRAISLSVIAYRALL